jgi:diguanylate cyclase (GGDEF)-like protein
MTNINFFSLQGEHAPALHPKNEEARLAALNAYEILDTQPEQFYDDITRLAAFIFKTPIALLTFIGASRQYYKSKVGVVSTEMPRDLSFCTHTIMHPHDVMVINNPADDPRFCSNPLVTGTPAVVFYAGVPIVTPAGEALGTLCVIDIRPHNAVNEHEIAALRNLARQVMTHMDIGKSLAELQQCQTQLNKINQQLTKESVIDELTKLRNRTGFQQALQIEWERTFRHSNSLSLLMLDIDQFSRYRDEFGNLACEHVLERVAQLITCGARQLDLAARFCSDTFAVLLPETNSKGVLIIAERIRARIEQENWGNRLLTASIGVASYNGQIDADSLIADANKALRHAKLSGSNCVKAA